MRRIVAGLAVSAGAALAVPAVARAQDAVITGRVVNDRSQEGIAGATVSIAELGVGVLTNSVGAYTLTVPAARVRGQAAVLQVRFIGYRPARRSITLAAGRTAQNFTLETDVNRLSEIVVTGVSAATERAKVPFAVQTITAAQTPVPGINPLSQLAGKVPGANIVAASGRPGVAPEVLLRGPKSFNATGRSQEPLYIVDGVILAGTLADLNPQDIETVEVVAGTAAASLYGSQAANGVIQITTKRGRGAADGVRFSARSEYGVNDIENEFRIARRHSLPMDPSMTRFCISSGLSTLTEQRSCARSVDWLTENLRINDQNQDFTLGTVAFPVEPGSGLTGQEARKLFQVTPWPGANFNSVAQLARPKPLAINNVDMTGKFGATDVFAAVNNTRQGGAVRFLNGFNRSSGRINAGQQVGTKVTINAQLQYSRTSEDGFNQDGSQGAFFRLTRSQPIVDLTRTDSRGQLLVRTNLQSAGTQNENPLYALQNIQRWDYRNRVVGSASARFTPATWFNADAQFGVDNQDLSGRQFWDRGFRVASPTAIPNTSNGNIFNYSQGNRSVNGAAGFSLPNISPWKSLTVTPNARVLYLQQDFDQRNVGGNQLTVSAVENITNALQTSLGGTTTRTSIRQLTYLTGLRAELNDRYVLDASVRRDGNSTFGEDNRWQTYGRIAGNWIVSNESFFAPLQDKIDLLKFSANYGTSGLAPSFAAQYEAYTIGAGGATTPQVLGNPNLRPQVDEGFEVNAEIGFLKNFNLQTTFARSDTRNQIDIVNIPLAQRFQQQWQNIGTLRNSTVELSLGFPIFKSRKIDWTGRANYASTITTITKLDIPEFRRGATTQNSGDMFFYRSGERFSTIYGRKFANSCDQLPARSQASCGTPTSQFQRNSDGLIVWTGGRPLDAGYSENLWNTSLSRNNPVAPYPVLDLAWGHPIVLRDSISGNPGLQLPLGQTLPKARWALSQNFSWSRFTAYALVDASVGQSVYNQAYGWSFLDFLSADQDQAGRAVGDVKPQSYYYRTAVESNLGVGGLYDVLGPNSFFVEKASFAKLRELTVSYRFGKLAGVGDWSLGVTGRNLHTWTNYRGFDPEVGAANNAGAVGSGIISGVDAFGFPNLRTVSFTVQTRF
jgi:TonB-linked SusC/RagA family outer membrane protein